jgi:hypothetical protein
MTAEEYFSKISSFTPDEVGEILLTWYDEANKEFVVWTLTMYNRQHNWDTFYINKFMSRDMLDKFFADVPDDTIGATQRELIYEEFNKCSQV